MTASLHKLMTASVLALTGSLLASAIYADELYPASSNRSISQGRDLWMQNCEACHGYGIADAPVPMHPEDWRFRLAKGKQVLYEHAIDGFIGPDYSMMPARGGNENLNDNEVKLAVDYMVFLASYYINKLEINEEVNDDSTTN